MTASVAGTRLLTAACTVAALAGCGGEEDQPAGRTVTVQASQSVEVVAREYFFDPETIVAERDRGRLEITLQNEGSLAHNLRVFDGTEEIGGTTTFAGGESRSGEVEIAPGTYRLVCTVADHEELGMVGELEVR